MVMRSASQSSPLSQARSFLAATAVVLTQRAANSCRRALLSATGSNSGLPQCIATTHDAITATRTVRTRATNRLPRARQSRHRKPSASYRGWQSLERLLRRGHRSFHMKAGICGLLGLCGCVLAEKRGRVLRSRRYRSEQVCSGRSLEVRMHSVRSPLLQYRRGRRRSYRSLVIITIGSQKEERRGSYRSAHRWLELFNLLLTGILTCCITKRAEGAQVT